jgi:1-acyl-sn-glycerol-3-phosphate acyltransferase
MLYIQIGALVALTFFILSYAYIFSLPAILLGSSKMKQYVKTLAQSFNTLLLLKGFNTTFYLENSEEVSTKMNENKELIDVIFCNHISTLDFIIITSYLQHFNIEQINYVLKKDIIYYPGYGVTMYTNSDIKLDRSWETDQRNIIKQIDNININGKKQVILIFPEGTRFTAEKMMDAQQFAIDSGYDPYQYTMFPKTKGTWILLNTLKNANKLGRVWDTTLIMPRFIRKSSYISDILGKSLGPVYGQFKEVELPQDIVDMNIFKKWFLENWKRKDILFENYKDIKYDLLEFKDRHYHHIAYIVMVCCMGAVMLSSSDGMLALGISMIITYMLIIFNL